MTSRPPQSAALPTRHHGVGKRTCRPGMYESEIPKGRSCIVTTNDNVSGEGARAGTCTFKRGFKAENCNSGNWSFD